jgi:hypothetical protein
MLMSVPLRQHLAGVKPARLPYYSLCNCLGGSLRHTTCAACRCAGLGNGSGDGGLGGAGRAFCNGRVVTPIACNSKARRGGLGDGRRNCSKGSRTSSSTQQGALDGVQSVRMHACMQAVQALGYVCHTAMMACKRG